MLERIELHDFRCWTDKSFNLAPTTIFTGPNGSGKTAILEAIVMLSLTTSWRTERDNEVVRWGTPFCRVTGNEMELVVQSQPYLKRLRVDGISLRTHQVIGRMPTVLFQPDDVAILTGAPSIRRHYIDRTISQTNPIYTRALLELGPVLKQRNRLLKQISEGEAHIEELAFWDTELARLQAVIQPERAQFVEYLNSSVAAIFREMVPEGGDVRIEYQFSPRHTELSFLEHLLQNRFKELAAGVSLYGPHREDIALFWGEHVVSESMSRGQGRALLLACKIAELEYIASHAEVRPILLLDDIFSEFDKARRERLFAVLGNYQTVMSTTEISEVQSQLSNGTSIIEV